MGNNKMAWDGPITFSLTAGQSDKVITTFALDQFKPNGFFSLQSTVVGDGTVTFEYQITNAPKGTDAASTVWTDGTTAIVTSQSAGTVFNQFPAAGEAIFAKQIRIIASETTTTDVATGTIWPNVQ
jgi:Fe-S cluster assembly iron-binding protein IscA